MVMVFQVLYSFFYGTFIRVEFNIFGGVIVAVEEHNDELNLLKGIHLELNKKQIKRYLNYGQAQAMEEIVDSCIPEARVLMDPKAVYGFKRSDNYWWERYSIPRPVRKASHVAFAVMTIGNKVEQAVEEYMKEGEFSRSLVMDAIGSSGVSEVSDRVGKLILDWAGENQLNTTRAFSPGAGSSHWSVKNQKFIFDHLDCSKIGVRLTSSFLLLPQKSASFIVGLGSEVNQATHLFSCKGCPRTDCKYRYEEESCLSGV